MAGYITDAHLPQAEIEFPGITAFYKHMQERPRTFLNLVAAYLAAQDEISEQVRSVPRT